MVPGYMTSGFVLSPSTPGPLPRSAARPPTPGSFVNLLYRSYYVPPATRQTPTKIRAYNTGQQCHPLASSGLKQQMVIKLPRRDSVPQNMAEMRVVLVTRSRVARLWLLTSLTYTYSGRFDPRNEPARAFPVSLTRIERSPAQALHFHASRCHITLARSREAALHVCSLLHIRVIDYPQSTALGFSKFCYLGPGSTTPEKKSHCTTYEEQLHNTSRSHASTLRLWVIFKGLSMETTISKSGNRRVTAERITTSGSETGCYNALWDRQFMRGLLEESTILAIKPISS